MKTMLAKLSYAFLICAVSSAISYTNAEGANPAIPLPAKVGTVDKAISIIKPLHSASSHDGFASFKPSEVVGFELARDFPPFARRGQWCWEVDAYSIHDSFFHTTTVAPEMVLQLNDHLSATIAARFWVNAESGEMLHVAGGTANADAIRQIPVSMSATQIGVHRITDVAAALFEKRFSIKLPKNKIIHMENIALQFSIDGFAGKEDVFREIRFYSNKSNEPFVFAGSMAYVDMMEYEMVFRQNKGADPFAKEMSAIERRFHQNKGNLLGTVWAKKHGNEVRFYFPMPDPEPAPQHAGKPAAKPDTNPDAQKPAAQSGVQKPSAAQKR